MRTTDEVLIIGSGFAGLGMAIRLKQAGIHDFTILEKADGLGGTWRDNRYPGAACDVESLLYSFSFAPKRDWSRAFAPQAEILDYLEDCADRFDVRSHIRFGSGVESARFDEKHGLWEVITSDGIKRIARVLVSGCGGLSRPAYPDIPGLDRFSGSIFHSARWDRTASLAGKRVGVIGTGASAIQIVPAIAPDVSELYVYQRTPPWILPKPDRAHTRRELAWFNRVPFYQTLRRLGLYWKHELFALPMVVDPEIMKFGERFAARFLEDSVPDEMLREKLRPTYRLGCKRILLSNDYYPALNRKNVKLVTDRIESVRPEGIVTVDGKLRELDAIVLATGFSAAEDCSPFPVYGLGGRSLADEWRDGAEAHRGTTITGFPNLFTIVGPNVGLGHSSMILMIEAQVDYILGALRTMREKKLKYLAVRADAQDRYNRRIQKRLAKTIWATGCTSWYKTRSGKNTTLYPGFTFEYRQMMRRFDRESYHLVEHAPQVAGRVRKMHAPGFVDITT